MRDELRTMLHFVSDGGLAKEPKFNELPSFITRNVKEIAFSSDGEPTMIHNFAEAGPARPKDQKRGLPSPDALNRLTPLLEPASEKAQGGECHLASSELSILIYGSQNTDETNRGEEQPRVPHRGGGQSQPARRQVH